MTKFDLIKFDGDGFGLQEVKNGELKNLYNLDGDQLPFERRRWTFIAHLPDGNHDDFWAALEQADRIIAKITTNKAL